MSKLHPEDLRYWFGWIIGFVIIMMTARWYLVEPIINAIKDKK